MIDALEAKTVTLQISDPNLAETGFGLEVVPLASSTGGNSLETIDNFDHQELALRLDELTPLSTNRAQRPADGSETPLNYSRIVPVADLEEFLNPSEVETGSSKVPDVQSSRVQTELGDDAMYEDDHTDRVKKVSSDVFSDR